MVLVVFQETSPSVYEEISYDGDFSNPITTVHNGQLAETYEKKLYIGRPDGNTSIFTNITLTPDSSGTQDIDPDGIDPSGWGVKILIDPGHDPTETDWAGVDYGGPITEEDIGDITTDAKVAFWFRVQSPRGISIQNKTNIFLTLVYTETPAGW